MGTPARIPLLPKAAEGLELESDCRSSKGHLYLTPQWLLISTVALFMLAAGLFLLIAAPRDVLAASGGVALTIIGVAASVFQAILMYLENEQGKATKQGKASATKHPLLIVPPARHGKVLKRFDNT